MKPNPDDGTPPVDSLRIPGQNETAIDDRVGAFRKDSDGVWRKNPQAFGYAKPKPVSRRDAENAVRLARVLEVTRTLGRSEELRDETSPSEPYVYEKGHAGQWPKVVVEPETVHPKPVVSRSSPPEAVLPAAFVEKLMRSRQAAGPCPPAVGVGRKPT